jgi:hypothetical protein
LALRHLLKLNPKAVVISDHHHIPEVAMSCRGRKLVSASMGLIQKNPDLPWTRLMSCVAGGVNVRSARRNVPDSLPRYLTWLKFDRLMVSCLLLPFFKRDDSASPGRSELEEAAL